MTDPGGPVDASSLRRLKDLPYGTARTSATETLVRRIEASGPRELHPEALLDLIEAYTFSGAGVKAFTAFARVLRLWDDSPELFDIYDERNLFWEFKWVAGDLADFPEITREQAETFLADMRHRYEVAGKGSSAVAVARFSWSWGAGLAEAEEDRLRWVRTPRDEFDDCPACTVGDQTAYFTESGRFAEAVEIALTQNDKCNQEPARTRLALALSYLELGRAEEAARAYEAALPVLKIDSESDFSSSRGRAFELLARGGHLSRALRVLREDDQALLVRGSSPRGRLVFLLNVLAGLSANQDEAELPTGLSLVDAPTLGALHNWVAAQVRALVPLFDARSGTDFYARQMERALGAQRTGLTLPLGVTAAAREATGTPEHAEPAAPHVGAQEAAPAAPELSPIERAGSLAAAGRHAEAATAYAAAAVAQESAGLLADSGLAWAEAAHEAQASHDDAAAHEHYARAVPRLVAGGTGPDLLARVLVAWAPSASRIGEGNAVLDQIDRLLATECAPRVQADLLDAAARLTAAAPGEAPGRRAADAAQAAQRAGEIYAGLGALSDAAHAFWVAGKTLRTLPDTEGAVWALESACEGFALARESGPRAEAAGELIELLRERGDHARAEAVVASLLT